MAGQPFIEAPPGLTDLSDARQVDRLNQWLLSLWKKYNESVTADLVFHGSAMGDVVGMKIQGGIIKETTVL